MLSILLDKAAYIDLSQAHSLPGWNMIGSLKMKVKQKTVPLSFSR